MTDYEHMIISAERYALGRMTYIVKITVDYILEDIERNKLSKFCLEIIQKDIEKADNYGMSCDEEQWQKLLSKIKEKLK